MSTDEQRARTMCGWVGVEISRSRVRTPGKAGFGLYRVRGPGATARPGRHCPKCGERTGYVSGQSFCERCEWQGDLPEPAEWTAYAFTLEEIQTEVETAIMVGIPAAPSDLWLRPADGGSPVGVTTRWTSAYRGLRDLGSRRVAGLCGRPQRHEAECLCLADRQERWLPDEEPMDVALRPEAAAALSTVVALVGAGLVRMTHVEGCLCDDDRYTAACVRASGTVRQRQREANREFQAEHLERRRHGLKARHAAKLAEGTRRAGTVPPVSNAERISTPPEG